MDAIKVRYRGARLPCCLAERAHAGRMSRSRVELREPAEADRPGQIAASVLGASGSWATARSPECSSDGPIRAICCPHTRCGQRRSARVHESLSHPPSLSACVNPPPHHPAMTSDEIASALSVSSPSASICVFLRLLLVPPAEDRTVLLTTAGMQPLKPYFLARASRRRRADELPEVLSHRRHRPCRPHPATSRSSRCSATSRIGAYFKAEAIQFAWSSRWASPSASEDIWVTVFSGDERLGLGPDEEAIELWRAVGSRASGSSSVPARELLEAGSGRAERVPSSGSTSTGVRPSARPGRCPRGRRRALPGVLEPRLHAIRPGSSRPAAGKLPTPQHRHRPRPQSPRGDPAGPGLGLRHRPVPAADRPRPGALRSHVRGGPRRRPRAAHPRRSRPWHVVPDRRRRRSLQRGPRLCPAPSDPPRVPQARRLRRPGSCCATPPSCAS